MYCNSIIYKFIVSDSLLIFHVCSILFLSENQNKILLIFLTVYRKQNYNVSLCLCFLNLKLIKKKVNRPKHRR